MTLARFGRSRGLPPVKPLAPSGIPAPLATASQDDMRERRRRRQPVHYRGDFNLATEVAAVCGPVATDASRLPEPTAMRRDIEAVADAVHELLSATVGLIAADRHAADPARTRQLAADLAVRPAAPAITDDQIVSGSWAVALAKWVLPYSGDLASLLGRALPPDHLGLRGNPSASERLERALRTLDGAVLELARRIPKVGQRQRLPSMQEYNRAERERREAERQQRALAKFGVGAV
jgi:hypothetical protein